MTFDQRNTLTSATTIVLALILLPVVSAQAAKKKSTRKTQPAAAASAPAAPAKEEPAAAPEASTTEAAPASPKAAEPATSASDTASKPATTDSIPMDTSNAGVGAMAIGGGVGLDLGARGYGAGFKLVGNGYYTAKEIAPQVMLDAGGHVGIMYAGCGVAGVSCSLFAFEVVPTARVRYLFNPSFSFYGDAGLGLVLAHASADTPVGSVSSNNFGGVLHIAAGAQYSVNDRLAIVGEPVGLNIYFYDGSSLHYSLMAGVLYRL